MQKKEYDDNARRLMYANHMDTCLHEETALLENIMWSDVMFPVLRFMAF